MKVRSAIAILIRTLIVTALFWGVWSVEAQTRQEAQPTCTVKVQNITPDGWVVMTVNGQAVRAKPQSSGGATDRFAKVDDPYCEVFDPTLRTIWHATNQPLSVGSRIFIPNCLHDNNGRSGCKATIRLVKPVMFVGESGALYKFQYDPQFAYDRMVRRYDDGGPSEDVARGMDSLCMSRPDTRSNCVDPATQCDNSGEASEFLAGQPQFRRLVKR